MTPVAIASEPPQWWDIVGALGPLAILLAAGIAAIVGVLGLREKSNTDRLVLTQQTNADNRSEWWRRAQWALDNAMSADLDRRALGIGILTVLAYSESTKHGYVDFAVPTFREFMRDTPAYGLRLRSPNRP